MNYFNHSGGLIDRFCARHPNFGIPSLMKFLVIGQIVVYVLDLFSGGMASLLMLFDSTAILRGQVWRLFTFVLLPGQSNPFSLLLSCYFHFWIASMLEREWGSARFSLFYLSGTVLTVLGGLVMGSTTIYYVNLSIFLILAIYYGEMQALFLFVVPLKMKWLAWLDLFFIAVDAIPAFRVYGWRYLFVLLPAFVNLFLFTWGFWRSRLAILQRQRDPKVIQFRQVQQQARRPTGSFRHKCAVCGITDQDDPNMEFRYCSKCDGYHCYCIHHINSHIHIRED